MLDDPQDCIGSLISAGRGHTTQEHTRVRMTRMVYEGAEIKVLGDDEALLLHSPT